MKPLVSILIPAYNAEKWLAATVGSVLAQTWHNIEVIIVDDGSRDETFKIAKAYESKLLKAVSQENQGAAAARNNAMSLAQGDYIQWLDADDLLAPSKIERQVDLIKAGVSDKTLLTSAQARFYYQPAKAKFKPNALWQNLEPIDWFLHRFNGPLNVWMQPATWLVSRKLSGLAGPWNEQLSLDDDGEYSSRLIMHSVGTRFCRTSISYYRSGNFDSLSHPNSKKALISYFLSIRLCIGYLLSLRDDEITRQASVNFIQNRIRYFYPNHKDILTQAERLADDLGGQIRPPIESNKFKLVQKFVGHERAIALKNLTWRYQISAKKCASWLGYKLTPKTPRSSDGQ